MIAPHYTDDAVTLYHGGKHRACVGDAWDHDNDQPTPCTCGCHAPAALADDQDGDRA